MRVRASPRIEREASLRASLVYASLTLSITIARPWPASAPAGRSPAPPPPDAAGGRTRPEAGSLRGRRLSADVLSCAPPACLLCQRRPRNPRSETLALRPPPPPSAPL